MHYYQFRIAEWMLSTAHLTLEEEGVYRRLIDHYYDTESPFPEETQPVIRRLRLRGYEETVSDILEEFFVLEDGFWHHNRCDKEIAEYQERAQIARNNGKAGGRPKKKDKQKQQPKGDQNPTETQVVVDGNPEESGSKANQEPITKNQEPIKRESAAEATPPRKSKGSRLDNNWVPTIEYVGAAKEIKPQLTDKQISLIADSFRDYWIAKTGKDATKADWLATWRNWIRKENQFSGGSLHAQSQQPRSTDNRCFADRQRDQARKALAAMESGDGQAGDVVVYPVGGSFRQ